jgi:3-methylcrotonyl-CoA carboxylase alpha subunit
MALLMSGFRLRSGDEERVVRLEKGSASLGGRRVRFREIRREGELVAVETEGRVHPVRVAREGDRVFVACGNSVYEVRREPPFEAKGRRAGTGEHGAGLLAPMPGRVRKTLVRPGEKIAKGDVVLVLEAMKMEHAIRAPQDGIVTRLDHRDGDLVEAGTVLAEITAEET